MTTREIASLTGKDHRNILRDCDNLNEAYEKMGLLKIEQGYYTHENTGHQQYREFKLTKVQTFDLMTGYNVEIRIKVIRRWEELENKNYAPTNFIEALTLALEQAKTIEAQNKELEQARPKVEFYDQVAESTHAMPIGDAAKILGTGQNKLFRFLRDKKILMPDNMPYQKAMDNGWFEVNEYPYKNTRQETCIAKQTLITQKGMQYVSKIMA